jgi:uncharacterized protein YgiM (DUF1202 family)
MANNEEGNDESMMNERMTKAAVVLAALAVLVVFAASAVEAAEAASHGLITGASVYVRSGGAKAYRALGKLTKGQFVDVITVSNDGKWVRIVAPEQVDAWIFAKYVNVAGGKGVVTGDKVRVRSRPDLKGELVNRLDKGTALKVKGREGDWLRIAPPKGTVAWIHAQYVKRMTAAEVAAYRRAQTDLARREAEKRTREADLALKKKAEEARRKAEEQRRKREAALALKRAEDARKKREAELALKRAEDARKGTAPAAGRATTLSGWVSYVGPGVERTGATHRIVKDGRVLALVKSARVDLGSFVGARVRVTGRAQGEVKPSRSGGNVGVIDVAGIEMVFN